MIDSIAQSGSDLLPPHAAEAEAGVLGCILLAPGECLGECMELLNGPDAFYDRRHQTIYQSLVTMQGQSRHIDAITLQQHLKDQGQLEAAGGLSYLVSLPDQVPSAASLNYYLEMVREKHLLRRVLQSCTTMAVQARSWTGSAEELVDRHEREAMAVRDHKDVGTMLTGADLVNNFIGDLERRHQLQGKLAGIATGFDEFDQLTDGLQFGEQTIIAARPSQGKTAIGLNIVERVCLCDRIPTAIISLEMSHTALLRRLCAAHCNIPLGVIRAGSYPEGMFTRFTAFAAQLRKAQLFIYDQLRGATADRIAAIVRRLVRQQGVRFVLIDYLQKIKASGRHEKRTYEVGEVSGVLKAMAEENKIALLTLAQLSREPEKDKGRLPRLSDLADSAQIERDADTIAFIHREREDKEKQDQASLVIAKQRDGELGIVRLMFNGQFVRFQNRSPITRQEAEAIAQG